MVCDFYGTPLLEPIKVDHTKLGFNIAIAQVKEVLTKAEIKDLVIAIARVPREAVPSSRSRSPWRGRWRPCRSSAVEDAVTCKLSISANS